MHGAKPPPLTVPPPVPWVLVMITAAHPASQSQCGEQNTEGLSLEALKTNPYTPDQCGHEWHEAILADILHGI